MNKQSDYMIEQLKAIVYDENDSSDAMFWDLFTMMYVNMTMKQKSKLDAMVADDTMDYSGYPFCRSVEPSFWNEAEIIERINSPISPVDDYVKTADDYCFDYNKYRFYAGNPSLLKGVIEYINDNHISIYDFIQTYSDWCYSERIDLLDVKSMFEMELELKG